MGLSLNLVEKGVNSQNNTSVVRADLYYYGNGVSWNHMKPSGYIILNGSRKNFSHNFEKSRGAQLLASYELVVVHGSDGKKTVSASASFSTDTSIGTITTSVSKRLTDIARATPTQTETKPTYTDLPSAISEVWKLNQGISITDHIEAGKASLLSNYVTAESYGTGSKWHGPTLTRTIAEVSDFQIQWKQVLASKNLAEVGEFHLLAISGSTIVAGVEITKNTSGTNGILKLISSGKTLESVDIAVNEANQYFGAVDSSVKSSSISKSGQSLIFDIAGIRRTFTIPEIENSRITKIELAFCSYGTSTPLSFNGVYSCKLVKTGSEFVDIPNTFTAGDKLVADVGKGRVTLNGLDRPDLGRLGNDWEQIELREGNNLIGVAHSAFSEPSVRMKYREVFL